MLRLRYLFQRFTALLLDVEMMESHEQQKKTMLNTYKDTNSIFTLKKDEENTC